MAAVAGAVAVGLRSGGARRGRRAALALVWHPARYLEAARVADCPGRILFTSYRRGMMEVDLDEVGSNSVRTYKEHVVLSVYPEAACRSRARAKG